MNVLLQVGQCGSLFATFGLLILLLRTCLIKYTYKVFFFCFEYVKTTLPVKTTTTVANEGPNITVNVSLGLCILKNCVLQHVVIDKLLSVDY